MGERQNDGGPGGRRRVHPEGAPPGRVADAAGLEALLAAALIRDGVDAGAEQRAVAAFLAARESGARGARTRRRDDWRPRRRLGSHSLKATLTALVAGLTLSGVAVAGIGVTDSSPDRPREDVGRTGTPSPATTGPAAGGPTGPPESAPGEPDRPGTAKDTEAHCRAYERVRGRGKALDSTAWQQLTEAAGGAANVAAYCAERLEAAGTAPGSTRTPENDGNGSAGKAGNNSSGNADDNATRVPGNGPDGGQGNTGSPGNTGNGSNGGAGNGSGKSGNPDSGNP
ncbi:hypothetical protein ACH4CD_28355 [Streptomyces fungicidicus]|uniref:hypothetical protein n=1 Tax=Streptomyces fungicidicus TaxID=68203 RepID=UPI00378AC9E0